MVDKFLRALRRVIPSNDFLKHSSLVAGGAIGGRAIVIIASPILARLYTPEEFGILSVFSAITSMLVILASFKYELAIPIADDKKDSFHIGVICFTIVVIYSLVLLSMMFILNITIINDYEYFIWLIPIGVLLGGSYNVLKYWSVKTKEFNTLSLTRIKQSLIGTTCQLFGSGFGSIALILGHIASNSFGLISLSKSFIKEYDGSRPSLTRIKYLIKRYKKFPMYSSLSGFSNRANIEMPPLLFALFFSTSVAGMYTIAHRVLALPINLIGHSIGSVYFSGASEAVKRGKLDEFTLQAYKPLVSAAIPFVIILSLLAPDLFVIIFGESWSLSGIFAQWMAPWLGIAFITAPLINIFSVLELQKKDAMFQSTILAASLTSILLGVYSDDVVFLIKAFSFSNAFIWILLFLYIIKISGIKIKALMIVTMRSFMESLMLTLPLFISRILGLGIHADIIICVIITVATAVIFIKKFK